ncbi:MAG: hypothetical protein QM581_06550 [Pseudomonas sp.]
MSKYDAAIAQVLDEQTQQRASAALQAQDTTPEQTAQVIDLARRSGLPTGTVAGNTHQVQADLQRQELDQVSRTAPAVAQWATTKPENYSLAQDDMSTLGTIGQTLADLPRAVGAALPNLFGQTVGGVGDLYNTTERTLGRGLDAVGLNYHFAFGREDVPLLLRPGDALARSGQEWKRVGSKIDVPQERRNIVTDTASAVGQLGGQLAQAVLAPETLFPSLLAQGADQMAERVEQTGKAGTAEGDTAILGGAVVTGALERYGLDKLLHGLPMGIRQPLLKRVADLAIGGGIEATQEVTEGIAQDVLTQRLLDPNAQIGQDLAQQATVAGSAGVIARAVINGIAHRQARAQAHQERQVIDTLVDQTAESKLKSRSPEALQELVETAQPGQSVYVPLETLQAHYGTRAEQAVTTLTGDPNAFAEATSSGAEVQIPLSRYVSIIDPAAHAQLADHLRLQPSEEVKPGSAEPNIEQEVESTLQELREQEAAPANPDAPIIDPGRALLSEDLMDAQTWGEYQAMRQSAFEATEQARAAERERFRAREQARLQQGIRKQIQAEVQAEIAKQPVYKAVRLLKAGKLSDGTEIKLNADDVLASYGQKVLDALPGMTRKKGGPHPDDVAPLLGYRNGGQMLHALTTAPKLEEVVRAETDARMPEIEDGYRPDDGLDPQAKVLLHEVQTIERRAGGIRTHDSVLRETARRLITEKQVTYIAPAKYRLAEAQAARDAYNAASKGRWSDAASARRRQLQALYLYREARNAREDATRIGRYLAQFAKKKTRQTIGKAGGGYLAQIDALLDRFNFAHLTRPQMAEREGLAAWIQGKAEQGIIVDVPPSIADEAFRVPFKQLRMGELRDLHDAVRTLAHAANESNLIRIEGETRDLQDTDTAMAQAVREGNKQIRHHAGDPTWSEAIRKEAGHARGLLGAATDIARELDGFKDLGAVWSNTVGVIRKANDRVNVELRKAMEATASIKLKHYSKAELRDFNKARYFPELEDRWSKGRILALALNWGNAGNREAILTQNKARLSPEHVGTLLRTLDARDWAFVQDVWDHLDSYWPQIAEAQRRRTGLAPEKIERSPFAVTTRDGQTLTVTGGYYPLKFEADSVKALREEQSDLFKAIQLGRFAKAATKNGHTIERVGSGGRTVRLDLGVIDQHQRDVIRDLHLGDAVNYVYRALKGDQFAEAIRDTGKLELLRAMDLWLKDAASGEMGLRTKGEQVVRSLRSNFTASVLTYKVTSALAQLTGVFNTSATLGKVATVRGVMELANHPVSSYRRAMQSDFMRQRLQTHVEAVQAVLDADAGRFSQYKAQMIRHGYAMMQGVQSVVDVASWVAAERVGLERFKDLGKARQYADDVVARTQGSGEFIDKNAIQRGTLSENMRQSEWVRATTTLQGYLIAVQNAAYERTRRTNFRNPLQTVNWMVDLVQMLILPGIVTAIIRGQWPKDEDDDGSTLDDWILKSGEDGLATLVGGIPGLSAAASELRGYDAKGVVADAWESAGRAITQAKQGELDKAAVKSAINVASFATGVPASQINTTIDAIDQAQDGEPVSPWEYVNGPQKDRDE